MYWLPQVKYCNAVKTRVNIDQRGKKKVLSQGREYMLVTLDTEQLNSSHLTRSNIVFTSIKFKLEQVEREGLQTEIACTDYFN